MAPLWVVGDSPHIETSFYVGDTLTDPGTVSLTITDPAGTPTTYTYAGGTVTKASTGVYYRNHPVGTVGKWTVQWTGTAPVADVSVETFTVHAAAPDTLDVLTTDEARDILKLGEGDATQNARLASAVTAISRRLDDEFGPIVKRTIAVKTYEPAAWDLWVDPSPLYSTPAITITEYDSAGASQVLTLETHDTKPAHGYRLQPRAGLGLGYTGRIRRTEGSIASTWGTVRVTYDAGRYASTGTVDPVFKEAAGATLINWWQQVLAQPAQTGVDLDTPYFRFPGFAIPRAAMEIVPVDERAARSVLA